MPQNHSMGPLQRTKRTTTPPTKNISHRRIPRQTTTERTTQIPRIRASGVHQHGHLTDVNTRKETSNPR